MDSGEGKLVLYVDPAWRIKGEGHIPLLFPFWGNTFDKQRLPFHHALFERFQFDTSLYAITDKPTEADVALLPYGYTTCVRRLPGYFEKVSARAHLLNLPLVIDAVGDTEHVIKDTTAIILQYGGFRFEKDPRVIYVPTYADDLLARYLDGNIQLRKKHPVPIIGFAGWGTLTYMQKIRAYVKESRDRLHGYIDSRYKAKRKGVFFRIEAIQVLEESEKVDTLFVKRTAYSGNVATAEKNQLELQKEFVDNLISSDYGLDIRGDANASTRLFEMLSLGCIPLIVDTERPFPCSDVVDYTKFSLIVDFRDIQRLPEIISEFHQNISEEDFMNMQKEARSAYENHFRIDALTRHITSSIRKRLS
jgi:Exostosin family